MTVTDGDSITDTKVDCVPRILNFLAGEWYGGKILEKKNRSSHLMPDFQSGPSLGNREKREKSGNLGRPGKNREKSRNL